MAMLEIRGVHKSFHTYAKPGVHPGIFGRAPKPTSSLDVLRGVDLTVEKGDVVAILGPSGSGKTTLLRCLNFLETADAGKLTFDGETFDLAHADRASIARLRRKTAFVFQNYNLFRNKTALQNVTEGLIVARRTPKAEADAVGMKMLEKVGLADRADYYPRQLSGGQQQRVAIARALATNPKVLLCDEATSALDPKTTRQILELIGDINKKLGITVVIITHQMSVVKSVCNHVAILDDGEVVEDGLVSTVLSAPKSAAARHLVFPGGADVTVSDPTQERRIRLIFRSAKTTSIPLVAQLATEEGISATVISANTQKLSEEVYGSMLLGVPNAQFEQAMDFLRGIENLQVEEASVDVQ